MVDARLTAPVPACQLRPASWGRLAERLWCTVVRPSAAIQGVPALALALLAGAATAATAQDAIPDLKGTWNGKGKSVVFGNNLYHPGPQTADAPPRVRDIDRRPTRRRACATST